MANKGKVTQVIGPVVDVSFNDEKAKLPNIMDALTLVRPDGTERELIFDWNDGSPESSTFKTTFLKSPQQKM